MSQCRARLIGKTRQEEQNMRLRITLIALMLATGGLYSSFVQSEQQVIKLATAKPGSLLSAAGEPLVHCAMGKTNMPYEIIKVPWVRAQRDTEQGLFDGFFMASRNSRRDEYATWSTPFVTIQWLYVVMEDTEISLNHLSHLQFAANLGSARLAWLEEQYKLGKLNKTINAVDSNKQALKMVLNRRIDVALMNNFDLNKTIKQLSIEPLSLKTFVAKENPTALYFSKLFLDANAGFLDEFNASLLSCIKSKIRLSQEHT